MKSVDEYSADIRSLIHKAMDLEAEIKRVVDATVFTAEEWKQMYDAHRQLAEALSNLSYKYGSK